MSFTKLGVVIPLGAGGQTDQGHVRPNTVIERDGRVFLYYTGNDGASNRVCLAVSDDGVHFTKLGVVIPIGAGGDVDDSAAISPASIERDGRVFLYYTGNDGGNQRVCLAVSDDGVHFTKLGVVIPLGAGGTVDVGHTRHCSAIQRDGRVFLYYSGWGGQTNRVCLAVSDDGVHFTKLGVVIPLGAGGTVDDDGTWYPAVIERDGRVFLYYTGNDGGNQRVCLAVSDDGVHFTKLGVVIPIGDAGDIDDRWAWKPACFGRDGRVFLYYSGNDGVRDRAALAVSDSGY